MEHRNKISQWTAAALLFGSGASALAQTTDLTDVSFENLTAISVESASKFVQTIAQAPSSVEVITREDIRRHGWRTLSEALSSLTGVYTVTDKAYDFIGARGFLIPGDYNTRFLVLIDGQRINDNIYGQANLGSDFPLDMSLVERIEYVPGPGSSIYGSNAMFGVVNVLTRATREMPPQQITVRHTQEGLTETSAALALRFESGANLMVSIATANKRGVDQTYSDPTGALVVAGGGVSPDGTARGLDSQHLQQLQLRFDNGGLTLSGRLSQRTVQPSSALYGTLFNDQGLSLTDRSASIQARYRRQVSDSLNVEGRLEYAEVGYQADYPLSDSAYNRYINHDETLGRWWTAEGRVLYSGWKGHTVVAGLEAQRDTLARQQNFDVNAAVTTPLDVDDAGGSVSTYLQDEWHFADRWRLNSGLRYDRYTLSKESTSPRLALIWQQSDDTTFKLLAGQAYRIPNAYERAYANGVNYLANPALLPETISTIEAVWEQRMSRYSSLRVSAFDYKFQNLIAQVDTGSSVLQYQNQDDIRSQGLEVSWNLQGAAGVQLRASLSVNRTEDTLGRRPGFSPAWIAKLRASAPMADSGWLWSIEANALGQAEYLWNGAPQTFDRLVVVDAALTGARVSPGLGAHVRLRNVFDQPYSYPASAEVPVSGVPGMRRSLEVGLTYAF